MDMKSNVVQSALLFLFFVLAVAVGCLWHEIGQDEAQAWNVARAADSFWDVAYFGRNEGHTPFWHGALWFFIGSGNPLTASYFSGFLIICTGFLLLRDRPFVLPICALVLFGYFVVFEYAVIARPYALALFFSAWFASSIKNGHFNPLYLAVILALLAFTSAFGVALSGAFVVMLFVEWLARGRVRPKSIGLFLGACVTYAAGVVLSVYYVIFPISENPYAVGVVSGGRIDNERWFDAIQTASFPHYDRLPLGIGQWLLTPTGQWLVLIAAVLTVLCLCLWLYRHPAALFGWLAAIVLLSAATIVSGSGTERHLGHLYMAALVMAWACHGLRVTGNKTEPHKSIFANGARNLSAAGLTLVLAYHASVGAGVIVYEVKNKQAVGKVMAEYIASNLTPPYHIMTDNSHDIGHMAAHLDIATYDQACACDRIAANAAIGRVWDPAELFARMCELSTTEKQYVMLLSHEADLPADSRFQLIKSFARGPRDHAYGQFQLWELTQEGVQACTAQ